MLEGEWGEKEGKDRTERGEERGNVQFTTTIAI
jgi:hypothetical protein